MAAIVPVGIEAWASFKSPDRLLPAIIPVTEGKKMPNKTVNDDEMSAVIQDGYSS